MKYIIKIVKDIKSNVAFKFSFSMTTFPLLIYIILFNYDTSTTFAFNNNKLTDVQTETLGNSRLYDNCLHNKKYNSLTVMIPREISNNNKSSLHYLIPVSTCIDFRNTSGDFNSFVVENSDREESESTNLIIKEGKSISIILDNPERKNSFDV